MLRRLHGSNEAIDTIDGAGVDGVGVPGAAFGGSGVSGAIADGPNTVNGRAARGGSADSAGRSDRDCLGPPPASADGRAPGPPGNPRLLELKMNSMSPTTVVDQIWSAPPLQ